MHTAEADGTSVVSHQCMESIPAANSRDLQQKFSNSVLQVYSGSRLLNKNLRTQDALAPVALGDGVHAELHKFANNVVQKLQHTGSTAAISLPAATASSLHRSLRSLGSETSCGTLRGHERAYQTAWAQSRGLAGCQRASPVYGRRPVGVRTRAVTAHGSGLKLE